MRRGHFVLILTSVAVLATTVTGLRAQAQSPPKNREIRPHVRPGYYWRATPVTDGAELLTLFQTYDSEAADVSRDLPLLAVLCDSLGDAAPENDRLSYVWLL